LHFVAKTFVARTKTAEHVEIGAIWNVLPTGIKTYKLGGFKLPALQTSGGAPLHTFLQAETYVKHTIMTRDDVVLDSSRNLHDGFFRMVRLHLKHRLFAGGWTELLDREVVMHGAVVAVIPYDPVLDSVVLIEQFRNGKYAAGDPKPWSVSIAAGMIEEGESVAEVARRETLEETGCNVSRLEQALTFYASPGGSTQHVTLFCAEVSAKGISGLYGIAEEGEDIRAFEIPFSDALGMVDANYFDNSISIVGLQWLDRNRARLQRDWT